MMEAARFFTSRKVIRAPVLNALGAQPMRVVFARAWLRARKALMRRPDMLQIARDVQQHGFGTINDFLPAAELVALREQCGGAMAGPDPRAGLLQHGPTARYGLNVDAAADSVPLAQAFCSRPDLLDLLSYLEGKRIQPALVNRVVERVIQGDGPALDPETELHSDTYYSTHKIWLYLTDVTMDCAPMVFVPDSQRLDGRLLAGMYRHSRRCFTEGLAMSRRVPRSEVEERGLQEKIMVVPANTLLVANTFGYHRRVRGIPGKDRLAIHMSVRSQPFLFWTSATPQAM
jgi:hypothetical protein